MHLPPYLIPMTCALLATTVTLAADAQRPELNGAHVGQVREDNELKLKLVWCPAGRFTMGVESAEEALRHSGPPVDVTLTRGFWIGQTEVTQAQWKAVVGSEPWLRSSQRDHIGKDFPAVNLTISDIETFCRQLTLSERRGGRLPPDWEYNLPTEAQWAYACRAGTRTRFSFGDDEALMPTYGWFDQNTRLADEGFAHRVAQKKPNPWGLYDVHGNVWELCRDGFLQTPQGGVDPFTPADGERVFRGGGWFNTAFGCQSAIRYGDDSASRTTHGFRIVLDPVDSAASPVIAGDRLTPVVSDEHTEIYRTEIPAGIDAVWQAFTTQQGLQLWMAPVIDVDWTIGGMLKANYGPQGPNGDAAAFAYTILSYDPERMISLQPRQVPDSLPFADLMTQTWSTFYFSPVAKQSTRITVVSRGYTGSETSQQMREHFRLTTRKTLEKLEKAISAEHTGLIYTVDISPDGQQLATASADGTIKIWDITNVISPKRTTSESNPETAAIRIGGSRLIRTLRGHDGPVLSAQYSPEGNRIVSCSGGSVWIWDVSSAKPVLQIAVGGPVDDARFDPSGERILGAGPPAIWDAKSGKKLLTIPQPRLALRGIGFRPDGQQICTGSKDGTINLWDAESGAQVKTMHGQHSDLLCLSFRADGKQIATGSGTGTIKLWDVTCLEQTASLETQISRVMSVVFSPNGKLLAACGRGTDAATLWKVETLHEHAVLNSPGDMLFDICFAPEGDFLAGCAERIFLWDLRSP